MFFGTLGKLLKDQTRKIASDLNLNVADKPHSQDICFVPNGDYSSVIKKYRPKSFKEGEIVINKENISDKDFNRKVEGRIYILSSCALNPLKLSTKNPDLKRFNPDASETNILAVFVSNRDNDV